MKFETFIVLTSDDHYSPEDALQPTIRKDKASTLSILDNCQADSTYNLGQAWNLNFDLEEGTVTGVLLREFKKPIRKQVELNKKAKASKKIVAPRKVGGFGAIFNQVAPQMPQVVEDDWHPDNDNPPPQEWLENAIPAPGAGIAAAPMPEALEQAIAQLNAQVQAMNANNPVEF